MSLAIQAATQNKDVSLGYDACCRLWEAVIREAVIDVAKFEMTKKKEKDQTLDYRK